MAVLEMPHKELVCNLESLMMSNELEGLAYTPGERQLAQDFAAGAITFKEFSERFADLSWE